VLNVVSMLFTTKTQLPGSAEYGVNEFWDRLGPEYIRKLAAGVARHVREPHRCFLMTDQPEAAPPGWTPLPLFLPQVAGEPSVQKRYPGWWAKLRMFDAALGLEGRTLYLDADNVLSGDLSALTAIEPDPLVMMNDRHYEGTANGSTMLCYPERLRYLWDVYAADPIKWLAQFRTWPHASDQAYIAWSVRGRGHTIPYFQDLLPAGYVLNSRTELEQGADWSRTHLVFGCWIPKPHVSSHPFYTQHWTEA
jgi:hypothetical protein